MYYKPWAGSGSDAEDAAHFARFGFDERVGQLATPSGFQAGIIRGDYKHLSNCRRTERVVKAMHITAINCAKYEIEGQDIDDFYPSEAESEDAGAKNK